MVMTKSSVMGARERFHAVMDFKSFDRMPVIEWAVWWDKTLARWYGEGLDPAITDRYDLYRHFGLDVYCQDWFHPLPEDAPEPPQEGTGIIASMDDYHQLAPQLYKTTAHEPPHRGDLQKWDIWQRDGEAAIWFTMDGFFWFPRTLLGIQEHLFSFYDEPELLHQINTDLADWMIRIIDSVCEYCQPDFMTFAEDLSYNNGPMLSKAQFDEFLKPYYERVIPHLKERGIRVFIDSDGNVHEPASWFTEVGIEGILPLERKAGVDIEKLRDDNPKQLYVGAFDKMTMPAGEASMRQEFERLLPVVQKGGFIISCDHQTPPGVSLDTYRIYLRLLHEYATKAAL